MILLNRPTKRKAKKTSTKRARTKKAAKPREVKLSEIKDAMNKMTRDALLMLEILPNSERGMAVERTIKKYFIPTAVHIALNQKAYAQETYRIGINELRKNLSSEEIKMFGGLWKSIIEQLIKKMGSDWN